MQIDRKVYLAVIFFTILFCKMLKKICQLQLFVVKKHIIAVSNVLLLQDGSYGLFSDMIKYNCYELEDK